MSTTMTIDLREFSIPEEEKAGRVFSRLRKIDQERKKAFSRWKSGIWRSLYRAYQ